MRALAALVAIAATLAACGGDTEGTGQIVDDAEIEDRIAAALNEESKYTHTVNCPDDGIEAGTDFTCFGYPEGLKDARTRIETHLDSDGETIEPFDAKPELDE